MHPGEEPIPDMSPTPDYAPPFKSPPPDYARLLGRVRAMLERLDEVDADCCSMCGDPVGDDGGYLVEADELVPFCAECLVTR